MIGRLVIAWLVHLYTASGVVIALVSILWIEQQKFQEALVLMFLAITIDATDGALARAAHVKEVVPWFDGSRLDDIVDYLNYVVVPALFLIQAELLPGGDALWVAGLPLIASAYGFCHKDAKTADHFFLGFPSYWNVVAFYLFVLQTAPWINGFVIITLSILVFVPIRYIYPSRSPYFHALTNTLGSLWVLSVLVIIYLLPSPPRALVFVSLLFPAYYTSLSLWLEYRRVAT